jgi:hypothetical protein
MSEHIESPAVPSLLPIKAWPHPWPSSSAWRHLIFNSASNGLDELGVIYRIGSKAQRRRILIHEQRFYQWCDRAGLGPEFRAAQQSVLARSPKARP